MSNNKVSEIYNRIKENLCDAHTLIEIIKNDLRQIEGIVDGLNYQEIDASAEGKIEKVLNDPIIPLNPLSWPKNSDALYMQQCGRIKRCSDRGGGSDENNEGDLIDNSGGI